MEEEKRTLWLELFRRYDSKTTYDQLEIKEPFNTFFKGVLMMDRGLDIQEYYNISLHLILFLTLQKEIKQRMERTEEEAAILKVHPVEIFGPSTQNMPKLFVFTKLPELSLSEAEKKNIKGLIVEICKNWSAGDGEDTLEAAYLRVLLRILRNGGRLSCKEYMHDISKVSNIPKIEKMISSRFGDNDAVLEIYQKYKETFFLNYYWREREEEEMDSVFTGICYKYMDKLCAVLLIDRKRKDLLISIFDSFLLMDDTLGYFKDFVTESLIICFTSLFLKAIKRSESIYRVFDLYREIGFTLSYRLDYVEGYLFIDDLMEMSISTSFKMLSKSIYHRYNCKRREERERREEEFKGRRFVLSPLSGRMSKIIPYRGEKRKEEFKGRSRRVLFKE